MTFIGSLPSFVERFSGASSCLFFGLHFLARPRHRRPMPLMPWGVTLGINDREQRDSIKYNRYNIKNYLFAGVNRIMTVHEILFLENTAFSGSTHPPIEPGS